jgi:hypothetical protein
MACQLVREMMTSRPPGAILDQHMYADYCRIAEAIERGDRLADLLEMEEAVRWPSTLSWLKERLTRPA